MASLQETKQRMNSVKATKKITKAMELVATAKLGRTKKNLDAIQEYYTSVFDTFQSILSNVKDANKLFPQDAKKSTLYIIITSEMGLCGAYNSNVNRMLKENWKGNDKLIIIGKKGLTHFSSLKGEYNIINSFINIGDEPQYDVASEISKEIIAQFLTGEVNKVNLIYTKFINSVTFNAINIRLLPVETNPEKELVKQSLQKALVVFEPSPEEVIKNSIPLYISAMIFGAQRESKVSEMSSRRVAMENASDNADDLIKELNIKYNRARQANITQEIAEIVGGAEAI